MDWRRARHLASGALLAGALLAGATVGSAVLLSNAEHRGDPVGRLSAHLAATTVDAAATRIPDSPTHRDTEWSSSTPTVERSKAPWMKTFHAPCARIAGQRLAVSRRCIAIR